MKIIDQVKPFGDKVNFVDDNNVILGYDMQQNCCENAGWFIASTPTEDIHCNGDESTDLPGWAFDTGYRNDSESCPDLDSGGMVIFRITKGGEEKFIHLYNCHNGYYGHGFDFKVGEETIYHGYL